MSNNKKEDERINFTKSNIFWDGSSSGIFNLSAILKFDIQNNKKKSNTFCLSQSVLAGNMYSDKELLKNPPYLFQIAGSENEQIIYRSYIPNRVDKKKNILNDTYGNPLFDLFEINLEKEKAITINNFNDIKKSFKKNCFSAKVFFDFDKYYVNLEFPIRHININPSIKMWQVETGSILFPFINNNNEFDFIPSFAHFNSFNKIDIFYDYPYGERFINFSNNGVVTNFPCTIQLFSN